MRWKIVADERTIINTQGVRFVEKVDATYGGSNVHYELRVTYKGDKMDYRYAREADRDAQFSALRTAMESAQSAAAVDPHVSSTGTPPTREKASS